MELKSTEIEEGYTLDVVAVRQVIGPLFQFSVVFHTCNYYYYYFIWFLYLRRIRFFFWMIELTFMVIFIPKELLMDVRDKLLFEPVYAGNARAKIPPKSPLRIPWGWLPGALCLLQEVN